jgi:hypothetical protein
MGVLHALCNAEAIRVEAARRRLERDRLPDRDRRRGRRVQQRGADAMLFHWGFRNSVSQVSKALCHQISPTSEPLREVTIDWRNRSGSRAAVRAESPGGRRLELRNAKGRLRDAPDDLDPMVCDTRQTVPASGVPYHSLSRPAPCCLGRSMNYAPRG